MPKTGLPRDIIKRYGVTKRAWQVFRARKGGTTNKKVIRVKRASTSKGASMARRIRRRFSRGKPRRFHRANRKIPILPLVSLAPPAVNLVNWVKDPIQAGNFQGAAYNGAYSLLLDFAGYDLNEKKWTGGNMLSTYGSLFAGYLGHKVAQKFGVNRMIARVPILGKYVEL